MDLASVLIFAFVLFAVGVGAWVIVTRFQMPPWVLWLVGALLLLVLLLWLVGGLPVAGPFGRGVR